MPQRSIAWRVCGPAASAGVASRLLVDRQDDQQRIGPVGEDQRGADEPAPIASHPECQQAEQRRGEREARLHGEAARVARLPLRQQGRLSSLSRAGCSATLM